MPENIRDATDVSDRLLREGQRRTDRRADSAVTKSRQCSPIQTPSHIDAETGRPKVELRRMLDEGLAELAHGEGIEMDDVAWDALRDELRTRRQTRP